MNCTMVRTIYNWFNVLDFVKTDVTLDNCIT